MQTPDGRECPYYYLDAHRRSPMREGCHLLEDAGRADGWSSALCRTCEVPEIKRANQCPHMVLRPRIGRRRFWEPRSVLIEASCVKREGAVRDPMVGCGLCHAPLDFVVYQDEGDADPEGGAG